MTAPNKPVDMPFYASCRDLQHVHVQHANSIDDPYVTEVQSRRRVLLFDQPARVQYYNQPKQELICEDDHDLYPSQLYRNRMYTQSENMSRKVYYSPQQVNSRENRFVYTADPQQQQQMLLHDARPPPPSPFNSRTDDYQPNNQAGFNLNHPQIDSESYTPIETYDNVFLYETTPKPASSVTPTNPSKPSSTSRTRATSFSRAESCESATVRRSTGRSVRDRNRRRQSYNPRAYLASSSSSEEDSVSADCTSLGSVDFVDWRRRKRLSRLSASNSSIRSEMIVRNNRLIDAGSPAPSLGSTKTAQRLAKKVDQVTMHSIDNGAVDKEDKVDLKLLQEPDLVGMLGKGFGRSPPPSSNVLSGLSPTSVSRLQVGGGKGDVEGSVSSDSSL